MLIFVHIILPKVEIEPKKEPAMKNYGSFSPFKFISFNLLYRRHPYGISLLGALEGISPACAVLAPCGVAAADLSAKNSSQNCFLNAASPLRVRIPFKTKNNSGFRTPTLR